MFVIQGMSPKKIIFSIVLMAMYSFSTLSYADEHKNNERATWDVKSFPRLPSKADINIEIEGYSLPSSPKEGKALVYVVRPGWFMGIFRFGVYLDGKAKSNKVGHNRTRQFISFDLEPGNHTIFSRASN